MVKKFENNTLDNIGGAVADEIFGSSKTTEPKNNGSPFNISSLKNSKPSLYEDDDDFFNFSTPVKKKKKNDVDFFDMDSTNNKVEILDDFLHSDATSPSKEKKTDSHLSDPWELPFSPSKKSKESLAQAERIKEVDDFGDEVPSFSRKNNRKESSFSESMFPFSTEYNTNKLANALQNNINNSQNSKKAVSPTINLSQNGKKVETLTKNKNAIIGSNKSAAKSTINSEKNNLSKQKGAAADYFSSTSKSNEKFIIKDGNVGFVGADASKWAWDTFEADEEGPVKKKAVNACIKHCNLLLSKLNKTETTETDAPVTITKITRDRQKIKQDGISRGFIHKLIVETSTAKEKKKELHEILLGKDAIEAVGKENLIPAVFAVMALAAKQQIDSEMAALNAKVSSSSQVQAVNDKKLITIVANYATTDEQLINAGLALVHEGLLPDFPVKTDPAKNEAFMAKFVKLLSERELDSLPFLCKNLSPALEAKSNPLLFAIEQHVLELNKHDHIPNTHESNNHLDAFGL
ncbi:MAG: hypothetical protein HKM04_08385 [Legionellales bacterium]|nr:hypothetical protein [Legionellales bacterium]